MMQRPDIRGAIESLYSAAKGVQATKADFFPTLSLTGSIGTQAATVSALGASGTGVGALAAALSMPILNWGSLSAAKESAEASLDLAKANYRETLVTALEETDNALWAVKTTETSQKPCKKPSITQKQRGNLRSCSMNQAWVTTHNFSLLSEIT